MQNDLADDLLQGADEIADHMGPNWNRRRVYYVFERKLLPIFRLGNRLCMRKSTARRHVEDLEQAQRDGGGEAGREAQAS